MVLDQVPQYGTADAESMVLSVENPGLSMLLLLLLLLLFSSSSFSSSFFHLKQV